MAIFHLLDNLIWGLAGGTTPLNSLVMVYQKKVGKLRGWVDPNRHRSSSRWASFPFTRIFRENLGLGRFARWVVEWAWRIKGMGRRVNGSEQILCWVVFLVRISFPVSRASILNNHTHRCLFYFGSAPLTSINRTHPLFHHDTYKYNFLYIFYSH